MEVQLWIGEHWFDLLQTVGIVGGLLLTAYMAWRDERARQIGNLISINQQYIYIWQPLYDRPELSRVLKKDVNLNKEPLSEVECRFVKTLIVHLDTVRRASEAGMFVKIQALQNDVRDFFTLPIPRAVWDKIKPFQDEDFTQFIESALK